MKVPNRATMSFLSALPFVIHSNVFAKLKILFCRGVEMSFEHGYLVQQRETYVRERVSGILCIYYIVDG
jgi:hypothetical protein